MKDQGPATPLRNTCANGHKSVVMLPSGQQKCLDCGATW